MKTRVLTGLALFLPVLYLSGWAPEWLFMAVLIGLVERGLYEYFSISRQGGIKVLEAPGYVAGAAICLSAWAAVKLSYGPELAVVAIFIVLIPALAVWMIVDSRQYLSAVSATLFGILYIAFTLSCLFPLRFSRLGSQFADGRQIILFLLAIVCVGDIFAYFTGRTLGRRLIFPRVSPKKTIEGSLGGFTGSVVVGWAYAHAFWNVKPELTVILWAAGIAVAGQIGDLVESALKRSANLKDSGAILPGHGGLLDRVDSMLLAAPLFWVLLVFKNLLHK